MLFSNEVYDFLALFVEKPSWRSDDETTIRPYFRALARHIVVHKVLERINNVFDVRHEASVSHLIIKRGVIYPSADHVWTNRIQCDSLSREVFPVAANESNHSML